MRFLGYYLSSLVNFSGLQYISVGLERVILFTYPALVLLLDAIVLRRGVSGRAWGAAAFAWTGILFAFGGEARVPVANGNLPLGPALVFASPFDLARPFRAWGGRIASSRALLETNLVGCTPSELKVSFVE